MFPSQLILFFPHSKIPNSILWSTQLSWQSKAKCWFRPIVTFPVAQKVKTFYIKLHSASQSVCASRFVCPPHGHGRGGHGLLFVDRHFFKLHFFWPNIFFNQTNCLTEKPNKFCWPKQIMLRGMPPAGRRVPHVWEQRDQTPSGGARIWAHSALKFLSIIFLSQK